MTELKVVKNVLLTLVESLRCKLGHIPLHLIMFMGMVFVHHLSCSKNVSLQGLFQGYNATVLAYGQTGSGKTYTMGTAIKDGCEAGLIPQVMNAFFNKIEILKHQTEFQLYVSFIEILKEEVRDLLDSDPVIKSSTPNGNAMKVTVPGRPPIQIRESSNGVKTLFGSTEVAVSTLQEMAACLEQGSTCRATGSTNMNNQSKN